MRLFDGIKKLQNMADQAKIVADQLKTVVGTSPQSTSVQPSAVPAQMTEDVIPDASGRTIIQSEGQMTSWLESVSSQTKSPTIMKVIDAQLQVIKFVKAPNLLGMVLDNMIAALHQTLREASSEKEKTEIRESMSLMIQNLIFFSDAQLHYAIDKNKQEAKQLLSTAGDMLAKSVASVASLAAGPEGVAGVVIKNIFASDEMQNGFFGRLIGWIMDKKQIEKHKADFDIALKNLFDTFDRYSSLIGPSVQIHGMLHRYEEQLVKQKTIDVYGSLHDQFVKDISTLNDEGIELKAKESIKNLGALLAPLNITLEEYVENEDDILEDGVLQTMGKVYLGSKLTNKISKFIMGEGANSTFSNSFNLELLLQIKNQFEKYATNYSSQIDKLKAEIDGLSFMQFSAKKEHERQLQSATNELKFCNKVIAKLDYYIPNAKQNEEEIKEYANKIAGITTNYSLNFHPVTTQKEEMISAPNGARQKFDKMFELALADGEISENEKNILRKYAEAAGIDEGEFELMIENKTIIH
ncbi:MAG: TerB family tellurite resistance protein [Bacteroidales bacterium]|nr:TerB family tellurite resistance protein [Bacteroidales bacterium]